MPVYPDGAITLKNFNSEVQEGILITVLINLKK